MPEAASSTAAGIAGWKLVGGAAGVAAGGAGLAAVVVMCMTPPRSSREWAVALISTVLGSVCGGAAVVQHYNLHDWATNYAGLVALIGVVFACGLPAWAIVRSIFTFIARREGQGIDEVVADVRRQVGGNGP